VHTYLCVAPCQPNMLLDRDSPLGWQSSTWTKLGLSWIVNVFQTLTMLNPQQLKRSVARLVNGWRSYLAATNLISVTVWPHFLWSSIVLNLLYERDIPHRDPPGTFLFINFSSKYFNFIPNNAISFQIIIFHSKKNIFSFMFVEGFFKWWFQDLLLFFDFRFVSVFQIFILFFFVSFKYVFVSLMFSVFFENFWIIYLFFFFWFLCLFFLFFFLFFILWTFWNLFF
jgi:hypothetical protein